MLFMVIEVLWPLYPNILIHTKFLVSLLGPNRITLHGCINFDFDRQSLAVLHCYQLHYFTIGYKDGGM